jgi:hypothetical protein
MNIRKPHVGFSLSIGQSRSTTGLLIAFYKDDMSPPCLLRSLAFLWFNPSCGLYLDDLHSLRLTPELPAHNVRKSAYNVSLINFPFLKSESDSFMRFWFFSVNKQFFITSFKFHSTFLQSFEVEIFKFEIDTAASWFLLIVLDNIFC